MHSGALWCTLAHSQTAVHVVRVIEQCYFDSTSDPSNGQTANFILVPPKVIDPRTHVKKANLEGF